ncbi:hypothetical protein [Helicobacter acinonychis]|uniref:hypothetical protein n=1 Tax=Helicobacter acinonychis TaxID=212 RepID=UPI001CD8FFEE|nr:hypothetical protein [Helicobacter acinonychis]
MSSFFKIGVEVALKRSSRSSRSSSATIVFTKIRLKIPYFLLSTLFLTNTIFLENLIQ